MSDSDGGRKFVRVHVDRGVWADLKREAELNGVRVSDLVGFVLESYVNSEVDE